MGREWRVRWRGDLVALAVILCCTLILFKDVFLHGRIFYEFDTTTYYYPVTAWLDEAVARGRIPLWSPYIYGGFPLFADGEAGVFYPLNVVLLALFTPAQAFVGLALLRFFLAGAFCYAFLRLLQPGRLAALIGGLTFAFGSFMVAQMHHVNVGSSAMWLPLILFFAELALRTMGWRRVLCTVLGGAALGMAVLTIHIQPVLMSLLALGLYLLFRSITGDGGALFVRLRNGVLIGLGIVAAGLALGAVQMVPLGELALTAVRGEGEAYDFATSFSPALPSLITLLFPYFFRQSGYDYWVLWFRWETTIYVGIAPLLLAAAAILLRRGRAVLFFALLALLSLLLALGDYSPLKLYWLLWQLPGFSVVRAPGRFSFLFVFSVAALAAFGTQHLQSILGQPASAAGRRGLRLFMAGGALAALALAGGLYAAGVWLAANKPAALDLITNSYLTLRRQEGIRLSAEQIYAALRETIDWQNGATMLSLGLFFATVLLFVAWYRWQRPGRLWQGLLVLLVGGDLLTFAAGYHPQMALDELAGTTDAARFLALRAGLTRTYTPQGVGPTQPNRLLPYRVASVGGYSSLDGDRYRKYMRLVKQGNPALLDLWNVRFIVTPRDAPPPRPAERYRAVFEDRDNTIYENAAYLPRAFLVKEAVVVDGGAAALEVMSQRDFDPRQEVVVERGADTGIPAPAWPDGGTGKEGTSGADAQTAGTAGNQVQVVSYGSLQVNIKAAASEGGYLVLSDSYYPGWRATVDGQPATVYRGDYLFRAVRLPTGRHTITFRFDPISFKVGAAISLASVPTLLLVLVASYAVERRRARVGRKVEAVLSHGGMAAG